MNRSVSISIEFEVCSKLVNLLSFLEQVIFVRDPALLCLLDTFVPYLAELAVYLGPIWQDTHSPNQVGISLTLLI